MGYQEKIEEMMNKGVLNAEQAKAFEQSIAQLTPGATAPRRPLPLAMMGTVLGILILGGFITAVTMGAAPAAGPEVIQNVSQAMNQPDVTGNIGSTASNLMAIFLLLMVPVTVITLIIAREYNTLVGLDEDTRRAKGVIESSLQRRHDLLPNLMTVVKQAMSFEETLQSSVTEQRSGRAGALEATLKHAAAHPADPAAILPQLSAVIEAYPALKAQENILSLQYSLQQIEDGLLVARNIYNAAAAEFNSEVRSVTGGFVAGLCGMKEQNYFSADTAAHQKPILS